ncbi:MAG: hypothetical protein ACR2ID_01285 [Chthoniobacterales bacterium]
MTTAHPRAQAKIWMITVSTLLLAFRTMIGQGAPSVVDAAYIALPETRSPDGRLGVAWSVPRHPDLETRARAATADEADSVLSDIEAVDDEVVNLVVELQSGKVLAQLTTRYWEVGELRPNRHHLEVVWSPRSDVVLANHTFRWDCRAFNAVRIGEGGSGVVLDLKKDLDAAARSFFSKMLPRRAPFSKRDLAISFSDVALLADGAFKVSIDAEYPSKTDAAWSGQAVAHFVLRPVNAGRLSLSDLQLAAPDSE